MTRIPTCFFYVYSNAYLQKNSLPNWGCSGAPVLLRARFTMFHQTSHQQTLNTLFRLPTSLCLTQAQAAAVAPAVVVALDCRGHERERCPRPSVRLVWRREKVETAAAADNPIASPLLSLSLSLSEFLPALARATLACAQHGPFGVQR